MVTLADAATMAAGYKVDVHNNSAGNITVTRATGGDTINGAAKAITLPAQQHLKLRVNAAANGYIIEENTGGLFLDPTDPSKQLKLDLSAITTGTVRTLTLPDANTTIPSGQVILLNSGAASGATLDIVMTSYTAYAHKLLIFDLIPANDGVNLYARVSTDGGGTYDAGANNYGVAQVGLDEGATSLNGGATTTQMNLAFAADIGNGAAEGISGVMDMWNTTSTAKWPRFFTRVTWVSSDVTPRICNMSTSSARKAAQDTDAIRLLFDAGNISSGTWRLYGYN